MAIDAIIARNDVADMPRQRANLMFFGSDYHAGFAGGAHDGGFIDRFQGVQVNDSRFVAEIPLQDPGCAHGFGHHRTAGDDAKVFGLIFVISGQNCLESVSKIGRLLAKTDDVGLSKDERSFFVGNDGSRFTSEADVLGSYMLQQEIGRGLSSFDGIAGNDYRHVGQAAHRKEVFESLVSSAVGADGNASVGASDHDVEVAVAD